LIAVRAGALLHLVFMTLPFTAENPAVILSGEEENWTQGLPPPGRDHLIFDCPEIFCGGPSNFPRT
jgi:hypothetical protein